jgi:hypothetical protein
LKNDPSHFHRERGKLSDSLNARDWLKILNILWAWLEDFALNFSPWKSFFPFHFATKISIANLHKDLFSTPLNEIPTTSGTTTET